jgi:aarF domain-containing kinase
MTAEFIDGFKVSDRDRITREKYNIAEIDTKMFKLFAEQIFRTGFVHADPHPGNIFIRRNKKGITELVLLDHGLYENLSLEVRSNLCYFWEAIVRQDFEAMRQYAAALEVSDHMRFAEILLQRPMSTKVVPLTTRYTEADLDHMKLIASKRFDIIMDVLKDMPRSLLFIVRNLNTVRAIAREHGDPVDRPKVMARSAIECLLHEKNGIYGYFKYLTRKIHFEYKLW